MTQSQLNANRANAQLSTGPRTAAGKARSRFNALKHRLDAREEVLLDEDPQVRAELSDAYREDHHPQGATQTYLVETLAQKDWERKRFLRVAAQVSCSMLAADPSVNSLGAAMLKDPAGAKLLDRIHRRLDTAHRAWMKALAELRRLQKEEVDLDDDEALVEPVTASNPSQGREIAADAPALIAGIS